MSKFKAFIFFLLNVSIYIAAENMACIYIKQYKVGVNENLAFTVLILYGMDD